jgi:hypothetical protein
MNNFSDAEKSFHLYKRLLGGKIKLTKSLSQTNLCSGRDSNRVHIEALPIKPSCCIYAGSEEISTVRIMQGTR